MYFAPPNHKTWLRAWENLRCGSHIVWFLIKNLIKNQTKFLIKNQTMHALIFAAIDVVRGCSLLISVDNVIRNAIAFWVHCK